MTRAEFAQKIKAQYPQYASLSDEDLATRMLATYPQYQALIKSEAPPKGQTAPGSTFGEKIKNAADMLRNAPEDLQAGVVKGAAHTALDLGSMVSSIPVAGPALTAAGNAVGGAVGKALYGTTAAPVEAPKAFEQARQDTAYSNTTQRLGGALETVGESAIPITKAASAIPSTKRAGQAFQSVMKAAHAVPVDVEEPGRIALRIQELADRGGSMPMAVRKLINRITNPNLPQLTYEEARDFASNISRLSANEYQRLTPVVGREVASLSAAMNRVNAFAAQQAGKGAEYASAMKEYAQAMRVRDFLGSIVEGAKKAAPYASGAGLGLYAAERLKSLLSVE